MTQNSTRKNIAHSNKFKRQDRKKQSMGSSKINLQIDSNNLHIPEVDGAQFFQAKISSIECQIKIRAEG